MIFLFPLRELIDQIEWFRERERNQVFKVNHPSSGFAPAFPATGSEAVRFASRCSTASEPPTPSHDQNITTTSKKANRRKRQ